MARKRISNFDARVMIALEQRFGKDAKSILNATVDEEDGILYITPNAPDVRSGKACTTFAIGDIAVRQDNGTELVDMSFSSECPVMRWGDNEILSHHPDDCDFTRLAQVGSILKNHDPNQIVGVPVQVSLDVAERKGRLTMRFGSTDDAQKAKTEVLVDKTLRGVSVGYSVAEWVFLKDESVVYRNQIKGPAWVAAKWSALEASLTPIPADPEVGVNRAKSSNAKTEGVTMNEAERKRLAELEAKRAAGTALTAEETRTLADLEAKRTATPAGGTPAPAGEGARTTPAPAPATGHVDQVALERTRIREIQTRCKRFGLSDEFSVELINSGVGIDQAAQRILDRLQERDAAGNGGSVSVVRDGRASSLEAMIEGVMVRAGHMKREEAKTGLNFANYTMYELARECLRSAGISDSGDKREVAGRALKRTTPIGRTEIEHVLQRKETITGSASDFSLLLAAVAYKTLMQAYTSAPIHYRKWCKIGSVSDFKDVNRIEFSEAGDLLQVPELKPYEAAAFSDKQEKNRVYTYGRIFTMSRQGIINDDLGGFLTIPQAFGRKARVLPQRLALKKLMANPVLLSDKIALCADGHGNYDASGDRNLSTLAKAELAIKQALTLMAQQKEFTHSKEADAAEYLNLSPRILLCNVLDSFVARTAIKSTGALSNNLNAGVINPLADLQLEVVAEANLANTGWGGNSTQFFMLADPNDAPVIEVVFLNGDDSPFMEEEDQTNVDGRSWKVRLDVGCEAIGYKGLVKVNGAA